MRNFLVLLCLILLMLPACQTANKGTVIAQVNQEKLTLAELQAVFTPAQWKEMSIEQKRDYVRQWIDITLLAQQADEQNLTDNPLIQERMKLAEKKVKTNAVIAQRLASVKVSEEELFNYYRIHMGDFSQAGRELKVQRIYVTEKSKADAVLSELRNGMNFTDAARAFSMETLGQNGGYMGVVSAADSIPIFWNALKNLKLYERTVVPAKTGFYIVQAYGEQLGTDNQTFEGLKEEIRQLVLQEKRQQIYDDLLRELKSKADITLSL